MSAPATASIREQVSSTISVVCAEPVAADGWKLTATNRAPSRAPWRTLRFMLNSQANSTMPSSSRRRNGMRMANSTSAAPVSPGWRRRFLPRPLRTPIAPTHISGRSSVLPRPSIFRWRVAIPTTPRCPTPYHGRRARKGARSLVLSGELHGRKRSSGRVNRVPRDLQTDGLREHLAMQHDSRQAVELVVLAAATPVLAGLMNPPPPRIAAAVAIEAVLPSGELGVHPLEPGRYEGVEMHAFGCAGRRAGGRGGVEVHLGQIRQPGEPGVVDDPWCEQGPVVRRPQLQTGDHRILVVVVVPARRRRGDGALET